MKNIKFETAKTYEQIMKEIHTVSERYYNKNTGEMWAFYEEVDSYYLIGNAGFKYSKDVEIGTFIPAPFQEEVIEWLWNEHKIHIHVEQPTYNGYFLYICRCIGTERSKAGFYDRNEAMEQGIIDALKLIN